MKKIKAIRVKITEEPGKNGGAILRIKLLSNNKVYEFCARKEQYENEDQRKSIDKLFLKDIKADQSEINRSTEEKKKTENLLKSLENTEIEEEDYE